MTNEVISRLLTIGSWLALMGGIWKLFDKAEQVTSPQAKRAVSDWLRHIDVAKVEPSWPATFISIFDKIFGAKHWSWRCFLMSSLASTGLVLILYLGWLAVFGIDSSDLPLLGWIFCITNLVPDYLSLLKARHILGRLRDVKSNFLVGWYLLLDLLLTLGISYLAFVLANVIISNFLFTPIYLPKEGFEFMDFRGVGETFLTAAKFLFTRHPEGILGVFLYSTLFTSVWVWLYCLSGFIVKFLQTFRAGIIHGLKLVLAIDEKPLLSLGAVSMLIATVVFWSIATIARFYHS